MEGEREEERKRKEGLTEPQLTYLSIFSEKDLTKTVPLKEIKREIKRNKEK